MVFLVDLSLSLLLATEFIHGLLLSLDLLEPLYILDPLDYCKGLRSMIQLKPLKFMDSAESGVLLHLLSSKWMKESSTEVKTVENYSVLKLLVFYLSSHGLVFSQQYSF